MRNRGKIKTWIRWRSLKSFAVHESFYHAMHGVSDWREYWWRYYERLRKLK